MLIKFLHYVSTINAGYQIFRFNSGLRNFTAFPKVSNVEHGRSSKMLDSIWKFQLIGKKWKTLIAHLKPYSSYISIQNSWRKVLKNRTISHFSGYICKVNAFQKFRNRRLHKHRFICNNSFVAMKSEFKHIISFLSRRQNRDPLVHLEWPV